VSGNILHLFRTPAARPLDLGWQQNELAEFYRVVALLARSGLAVSLQTGVSDEGDPWAVIVRDDTGDVLVHLARMDGQFVVASAAGPPARRGRDLRAVVDAVMADSPMVSAPVRKSDSLFLHPTTVLAAFIVTAWAHTETLQSRYSRPEPPSTDPASTDPASPDQRATQPQAPPAIRSAGPADVFLAPSSPALAIAAAALLAVSAYVTAQADLQGTVAMQVDPDAFVQAALAYEHDEAAVQQKAPEDLAGSEAGAVARAADGWTVADTFPRELVGPSSEEQPDQPVVHALAALPDAGVVSFLPEASRMSSEVDISLVLTAEMDAAKEAPTKRVPTVSDQGPNAEASAQVGSTSAGRALSDAEAPSVPAAPGGSWQAQGQAFFIGPIYETAARFLHLLPPLADGPDGPDGYGLPATPPATAGSATASESLASAPVSPAEPQPEPAANQNAQILLEFMADQSRTVGDLEISWEAILQGVTDAPEARKAVIFDAGWLAGRSFMLMPGVLMVEDDLLVDAIDVAAHFQVQTALLNVGDGLSLKLIGIVDILDT
jgi:hypothetical protein